MWSIIVHGGAGAIDASVAATHVTGCQQAVGAGAAILDAGGSALDAACAAVRVLEDDPVFNAGVGSTLDASGQITTDAALFRGADLAYGAIGAAAGIRHPIDLARAILEDGTHSLLVGRGAVEFARAHGVALCDPKVLETERSRARWWHAAAEVGDTVGAVVRDATGGLVAATSTGGLLHKYPGRVGDSPIAGAGTYARDDLGAVSATGHGETIMKTVLAYAALLAMQGCDDPQVALDEALEEAYRRCKGRGGLIAALPNGRVLWSRNTAHMGVAWADGDGASGTDF